MLVDMRGKNYIGQFLPKAHHSKTHFEHAHRNFTFLFLVGLQLTTDMSPPLSGQWHSMKQDQTPC